MKKILFAVIVFVFSMGSALAQGQMSPEEKEKKMDEFIQKQVEKLESSLKLEDWQTFYADSILTHDYHAMQAELDALQDAKVSNADLYTQASDKWAEKIYDAMHGILNEEQWAKYLKSGAAREKKARDKRKAKAEEANVKLN
ncbi:MAG: hypothetical protein IJ840_08455 [Bacteroidales bacterium]|nr:hypothetical protein [Bacteroidales bacterium]